MAIFDLRKDMSMIVQSIKSSERGLPTGIQALDDALLGLSNGEMVIIAGRPSMGKSSLARDIALTIGKQGRGWGTVLFCSLEMSCEEVVDLLAANLAKIDYHSVKLGHTTDSIMSKLDKSCAQLSTYNIVVNDDSYITPDTIREHLQELTKTETVACLIIDYLQLMSLRKAVESRQTEVAEISREFRAIAKEFNLPVVALSQLNRNVDYRESSRPRLSDLRESGAMEQDAHKVVLLHRPSYYNISMNMNAEDTGEAELIIAKNRKGPVGVVKAVWIREWMSFTDVPDEDF